MLAILATRILTGFMAADTAIQEEEGPAGTSVERNGTDVPERVPITPPSSARDSAGFLPIAPGVPANGTGGYITERATPEFIQMLDQQRAKAAEAERQAVEQVQFNRMLEQSRRTEDALKMIQGYKRLMATRKLGTDYQRAVSKGLPPAQAWAMAASQNLEAFGNRLSDVTSAIRYGEPKPQLSNELTVFKDPETGKTVMYGAPTSSGTRHVFQARSAAGKDEMRDFDLSMIKQRISNRQKQLDGLTSVPGWDKSESTKAVVDTLTKQIQDDQNAAKTLLSGESLQSGSSGALPLPPKNQLKTGQLYKTPKGDLVWNGKQFVKQ